MPPTLPEARIAALGLAIPAPVAPLANYVPFVAAGSLLFLSGQLPIRAGGLLATGRLGAEITPATGREAARQCFLNLLGQARVALGSLDRITRIVRLGGFIAATEDFTDLATIMNGASDLAVEIFDEAGRHARSTVGVAVLPANAPVEIEAVFAFAS